jgi:hypothetical protein
MNTMHDYQYYGTKVNATELLAFIQHVLQTNLALEAQGKRKTPICIWGRHGIGKTEIVESLALRNGHQLVYIAPAQFEEMGDLVGMPAIEAGRTVFRAPSWVPTMPGPGILLIDDVNRADERILRGIMQLLQNHELISWKLPPQWQILLTANPDGGDYSVTPMDDAMLTRMLHITLEFEAKAWVKWAEQNEVDPRGINFVLLYPEIITGQRTTPRTLVQFFEAIKPIVDLSANLGLVRMLADSCLDEQTASAFISFVNHNLGELISPETICNARDFEKEVLLPFQKVALKQPIRVDIIAALCTRLVNFLLNQTKSISSNQLNNLKSFIKIDFIPNDLRFAMVQELIGSGNTGLKGLLADAELGKLMLKGMSDNNS